MKAFMYMYAAAAVVVVWGSVSIVAELGQLPVAYRAAIIVATAIPYLGGWLHGDPRKQPEGVHHPTLTASASQLAANAGLDPVDVRVASWLSVKPQASANPYASSIEVNKMVEYLHTADRGKAEAVIAHELGHLKQRPVLLYRAAASYGVVVLVSVTLLGGLHALLATRWPAAALIVGIAVVASVAQQMLLLASRRCGEYHADDVAAQLGFAAPLLSVVETFDASATPTWFDTHPCPTRRAARLRHRR